MGDGDRYNYENDEYVYFLMQRAPVRSGGWNGMGLGGWEVYGV